MIRHVSLKLIIILIGLFLGAAPQAQQELPPAELKPSRYIGLLSLDGTDQKIVTIADVLLESPENLKEFPKLTVIIKLALGGTGSHEYLTETYKNVKYDYDTGRISLDEPESDLLINATLQNVRGRSKIMGSVFVRSASMNGFIELLQESNEPDDEDSGPNDSNDASNQNFTQILSTLDGEYLGQCTGRSASYQVQTVRGLSSDSSENSFGVFHSQYGIVGRLAFKDDPLCGKLSVDQWCTRHHFSNGSYNLYLGRLNFESDQSGVSCNLRSGQMTCRLQTKSGVETCEFNKPNATMRSPQFFVRRHNITPSRDQLKELPPPSPPLNENLAGAVGGSFFGFLHNEYNDVYVPLKMSVVSYSATDNPHNPNQMMVTATTTLYLGGPRSEVYFTQRFEARSFYLRPGFVLSGPNADSFIKIVDWKSGFIRGVFYSHKFGKVGTVQLVKGEWPQISTQAQMLPSFAGEFRRTIKADKVQALNFFAPTQSDVFTPSAISMSGSYQTLVGSTPVFGIARGVFDLFSGRIGWQISKNEITTFGSGKMDPTGDLLLFWPPNPTLGVITQSYSLERFQRTE